MRTARAVDLPTRAAASAVRRRATASSSRVRGRYTSTTTTVARARQEDEEDTTAPMTASSSASRSGKIISDNAVHSRYLTVYNRVVEFAAEDGRGGTKTFAYDVVGHPKSDFKFVCVAPFHSRTTTTSGEPEFTIIREYAQGSNSTCVVLPSGGFEVAKHASLEEAATDELHQEAHLVDGTLTKLIADDNPGLLETKWCRNRLIPFLCVDGVQAKEEATRDAEEFHMTHERVTVREFRRMMYGGEMMLPSIVTGQLAIDFLLKGGYLTHDDLN